MCPFGIASFWRSIYQTKLVDFLLYTTYIPGFSHWLVDFPVSKQTPFTNQPTNGNGSWFLRQSRLQHLLLKLPFLTDLLFVLLKKCGAEIEKGHRCQLLGGFNLMVG